MMKPIHFLRMTVALTGLGLFAACGSDNGGPDVPAGSYGPFAATVTGNNTMAITLATPTTPHSYVNEPLVSVKICVPGSTTQCQTINNILLDTGSFGLRIFSSLVTIPLVNETTSVPTSPTSGGTDSNPGTVAECAQFGTGMTWGPVATADIYLGNEPVASLSGGGTTGSTGVPIQLINSDFFSPLPTACISPDTSPESAGYNGILGVGQFGSDCAGSNCENFLGYDPYYKCDAGVCNQIITGTSGADAAFTTSMMVTNPATVFSSGSDSNGLAVVLPAIPAGGATVVTGTLIFGIGTASNNTPSGTVTIKANGGGFMGTQFESSQAIEGFIDSGSNGLYFPGDSSLPDCNDAPGFYCSNPIQHYTATMSSVSSNAAASINFEVVNADGLFDSGYSSFPTLAGSSGDDTSFDWGLPFFFGRTIYVGFNNKTSILGTGPYWSF